MKSFTHHTLTLVHTHTHAHSTHTPFLFVPGFVDEDEVFWLEVSMYDVYGMKIFHGTSDGFDVDGCVSL